MTDIRYDPEFPYVVGHDGSEDVIARFSSEEDAIYLARGYKGMWVIDTTPKPKIPEDAEFVQWDAADQSFYAMRYGKTDEWWVTYSGAKEDSFYYLSDLLIRIGDAEVTVLVRKEES